MMQINNPYTKTEILEDLAQLRNTDHMGYFSHPLGQLYMGCQSTEDAFEPLNFVEVAKITTSQNRQLELNILDRIDITPIRSVEFLLVRKDLKLSHSDGTPAQQLLEKIYNSHNALLAGSIKPASANSLIKMLYQMNYGGSIKIVEKNNKIARMLDSNIETYGKIKVELVVGDALGVNGSFDIIFCDVLGRYLSSNDFNERLPIMLNKLTPGGLALVSDMEEYAEVKDRFTLMQNLGTDLDEQEERFLSWVNGTFNVVLTKSDIIKLRNALFEEKTSNIFTSGLVDRYRRLLPKLSMARSLFITSRGYVTREKDGLFAKRIFDYMLFQNNAQGTAAAN